MSTPSFATRVAHQFAVPTLVGELVDWLGSLECELASQREENADLQPRIRAHPEWLQAEFKALNRELHARMQDHTAWQAQTELLPSVPDVGPVVATVLIAERPELGHPNGREIAALVGVAPLNRDSGRYRGQCRVWGERASVRTMLYMTAATRHNPAIRNFYTRSCRRGKPRKVTLVVAMHKLHLILNAVNRDQVPWQPNRVPMASEA